MTRRIPVLLLVAVALAAGLAIIWRGRLFQAQPDESVVQPAAPPSLAPALAKGTPRKAQHKADGESAESAAPSIHGVVLESGSLGRSSIAGVWVHSFSGTAEQVCAESVSRQDGTFDLREDRASARRFPTKSRGVLAEDSKRGLSSFPVFVDLSEDAELEAGDFVELLLRPCVPVKLQILDVHGKPAAGAEAFVRWRLTPGAHVEQEDLGAATPRQFTVSADGQGEARLLLPPGILHVRGRSRAEGALGPLQERLLDPKSPPETIRVSCGADDAHMSLRVTDGTGAPVPGAFVVFKMDDLALAALGNAGRPYDGSLAADRDGMISLTGVSIDSPPLEVGVGAPRHMPARVRLDPAVDRDHTRTVTLTSKLLVDASLVDEEGRNLLIPEVNWELTETDPPKVSDPKMTRSDDVTVLVEEVVPSVEWWQTDLRWTVAVTNSGSYLAAALLPGGLRSSGRVDVDPATPRFTLPVPSGRMMRIRVVRPDAVPPTYEWRLRLVGVSGGGSDSPARALSLPSWTLESDELNVWCPNTVDRVRLTGASTIDLPRRPVELEIGPQDANIVLRILGERTGELQARSRSASGTSEAGVEIEVLPVAGAEGDRPRGTRWPRTAADGVARLPLVPGEYFVSRSRRYGPPKWARVWVRAGETTDVVVGP